MESARKQLGFPVWVVALALSPVLIGVGVVIAFLIAAHHWIAAAIFVVVEACIALATAAQVRSRVAKIKSHA